MSNQAISNSIRTRIKVTGIVQGVGFRPYVYRHATELALQGSVLNNQQGVTIELQGPEGVVAQFIDILRTTPPPLARVDAIDITPLTFDPNDNQFTIIQSEGEGDAVVAVSADKSTCQDCLDDMQDTTNRHYQYPFTNCTNCGPRYTLIKALPYDRKHTSMSGFEMCADCAKSYQDPLDRRYHAQPVSCPACGPHVSFCKADGQVISEREDALEQTLQRLVEGKIIAIKGLGGFHLVCDATNESAVAELRSRKQRPAKPLAVMAADMTMAQKLVQGSEFEWQLLSSKERPITLMQKQDQPTIELAASVAPGIDKLGIFLPYTPLHHLLLTKLQRPIVATSANRSGEPIITEKRDIILHLGRVVDGILDHNRAIINGCDDSVVQSVRDEIQIMRMARGYAPLSLHTKEALPNKILAVGAQQKNSIAFGFNNNLFLSPHIGDLFSIEAETYFDATLATFKRLYDFTPDVIVSDKHPDYAPTQWANNYHLQHQSCQWQQVQHHYAHVLSVMAVNQSTESVLGFSFDGTGLGDDGTLWGGEALLANTQGFERLCHLMPFKLIGGEQAIKDPRRLLLATLFERYSLEQVLALPISSIQHMPKLLVSNLHKLWSTGSGCTSTSSMGRLFDAVACALGLIEKTQFEGQAGMLIEGAANQLSPDECDALHFTLARANKVWDTAGLMAQIVDSISNQPLTQLRVNQIADAFMRCLGDAVCEFAQLHHQYKVVLTGGVFQNRFLSEYCLAKLESLNITVLPRQQIPINDGGIALGQLWFGIHQSKF